MQPDSSSRPSVMTVFLSTTAVTWVFLVVQWLVLSGFGFKVSQVAVARTLLALGAAGLGLGLIAGVISLLIGRRQSLTNAAIAVPISLLLFLEVYSVVGNGPVVVKFSAATGFGVLVFLLVNGVIKKTTKFIPVVRSWWLLAGLVFSVALLLSAIQAVDMTGTAIAVGAALVAAVLVLKGRHSEPVNVIFGASSLVLILVASAVLASRIPVNAPDTAAIAPDRPSILLVSIDTLRADHVGVYGYESAHTPILDGLASEGVLFRETVSANVYTGPSHASILTGLLPENHGVSVNLMKLPESVPTLADILRKNGYVTGAFVSSFTTQDNACGLPSRFHAFDDDIRVFRWLPVQAQKIAILDIVNKIMKVLGWDDGAFGQSYRMGGDTADAAIKWLGSNGDRPFFMWVHFFDPHVPYRPPHGYLHTGAQRVPGVTGQWYALNAKQRTEIVNSTERMADMIALYDGEVAYADDQLGRVVAAARRAAPGQKLLIVATSDHGESMGEHDIFWARQLYDPTLLVPLIIVPADPSIRAVREVNVQVRLIDLAPTILELLEIESEVKFDGTSLVSLIQGAGESPGPALSGLYPTRKAFAQERHSIRQDGWKLIKNSPGWNGPGAIPLAGESHELYNVGEDPGEIENLVASGEPILDVLKDRMGTHLSPMQKPELHLTPEERKQLRSLGYVH